MSERRDKKSVMQRGMEYQEHNLHKQRLWTVKSTLDNGAPKKHSFIRKNLKKRQMLRDTKAEIQRRNNLLLDKLFTIDTKPSGLHPYNLQNNRPPSAYSLNRHNREKELDRIDRENRKILDKIQNAYSKYAVEDIMRQTFYSSMT